MAGCGLALDGKTVRNSAGDSGIDVQLFSAMRHDTADAAHPRHDTASYLVARHAGYVFTVKANKPALLTAITRRLPAATPTTKAHVSTERRSGYRTTRTIWTAPATGIDFPGAAQVFRIRRDVHAPDGQRVSKQIIHGITSLTSTAAQIAGYVRTLHGANTCRTLL